MESAMTTLTTAQAVVSMLEVKRHRHDLLPARRADDAFFDALYDRTNAIQPIHARHEQACAYMALGMPVARRASPSATSSAGPASSTPRRPCRLPMP